MRKFTGFILTIMVFASMELFAVKISYTLDGAYANPTYDGPMQNFATQLYSTDLGDLGHQKKLARGMGNAVAHAGNSVASFNGYEGYDIFAAMWGLSVAIVIPPIDETANDIIENKNDAAAGLALGSAFNVGINLTNALGLDFLPNRLYMNIKGAKTSSKGGTLNDADDWEFKTTTFGIGINYQLIDEGGERFKLYKWTGISFGSGFLYNRNKITFDTKFGSYSSSGLGGGQIGGYYVKFTPETQYGLDIKTYTIPLEVSTSARILWLFNFTAGAGFDLTFGTSKIIKESKSDIKLDDGSDTKIGTIYVDGSTKNNPTFLNTKILGGFGVCLGPIPVDASVTYYPFTNGIVISAGFGFVW